MIDEKKLIYAEDVINLIKGDWEITDKDFYSDPQSVELGIGIAIRIIKNFAMLNGISNLSLEIKTSDKDVPETNVGKWIPCSERLPKVYQIVFVTVETQIGNICYVSKRSERDGEDFWYALSGRKPIAWMPLPEPYKGE